MNWSPEVVLWTIFGLIGFLVGARNTIDNWRDLVATRSDAKAHEYVSRWFGVTLSIMFVEGAFASAGILSIFVQPTKLIGDIVTWLLVVSAALLMLVVIAYRVIKWKGRREP